MTEIDPRWKMVHFFGPDGAGKSTQVAMLARFLERQGHRTKVAWVRSPHTAAYATMRLLYALGRREKLYNPSGREFSRPLVNQGPLSSFLWVMLELVSAAPIVLKEAILPAAEGRIVVAERYVLDTAATIGFFLGDERFVDTWPARLLYRLLLKDTLLVFLDADYENVVARRGDIAEPRAFIDFQRRVYRRLADRMDAVKIYTPDHGIDETHEMIVRLLEDREGEQVPVASASPGGEARSMERDSIAELGRAADQIRPAVEFQPATAASPDRPDGHATGSDTALGGVA